MNKFSMRIVFLLFFALTSVMLTSNSYGFIIDEVAGSVDGAPITLNELYFFNIFNNIENLKLDKNPDILPSDIIKRNINIYINRLLILKQETKINMISIPKKQVEAYIKDFKKKFNEEYKNKNFSNFLEKYGLSRKLFYNYVKNIMIVKEFIVERLKLFINAPMNISVPNSMHNAKIIRTKEMLSMLKDWITNLRMHAKIDINDNY